MKSIVDSLYGQSYAISTFLHYVADKIQGHQAGDCSQKKAFRGGIEIQDTCQGIAGDAGHSDKEIQDCGGCQGMLLAWT